MLMKTTTKYLYVRTKMPKMKKPDYIKSLSRLWRNRKSHTLLVGMENGTTSWENFLPYQVECIHTLRPCNTTPRSTYSA